MVKKLNWDTECFGYSVGRITIDDYQKFNIDELQIHAQKFKLLYIYSKTEIPIKFKNFYLVDKKVVFKRKTEQFTDNDFSNIESYKGDLNDQLLDLTFQSGIYSRFKSDKCFVNNEFQTLYRIWILNSIRRIIARDVFIYKIMNELVGFITLALKDNTAEIGLIAVDNKIRGKGIGSKLVKFAINESQKIGYPEMLVTTQLVNESAVALYKKNGFELSDLTYIYHYWNK